MLVITATLWMKVVLASCLTSAAVYTVNTVSTVMGHKHDDHRDCVTTYAFPDSVASVLLSKCITNVQNQSKIGKLSMM